MKEKELLKEKPAADNNSGEKQKQSSGTKSSSFNLIEASKAEITLNSNDLINKISQLLGVDQVQEKSTQAKTTEMNQAIE
jgi:hypothetical protein